MRPQAIDIGKIPPSIELEDELLEEKRAEERAELRYQMIADR